MARQWLGTNLRLSDHEFDLRPPHYQLVGTEMGDRLRQVGLYHRGQLSLLTSVVREMSIGQNAMMRCGWGSKAEWRIPFVDKSGWQVLFCTNET